jgi:type IV secretion system protein VirD4
MKFKAIDRNVITLVEAIAVAVFVTAANYMFRSYLVNFDGFGTTVFTWRAVGLALGLGVLWGVYLFAERRWLCVAFTATGLGLVYGLGINGTNYPRTIGTFWDTQALWYYATDALPRTHATYFFYVSVAWVSVAGWITAVVAGAFSINMMESTLKELRGARSHNGTNRYRSRETVFGDAHWGSWRKMAETVGDSRGIVLGEDYDPRHNDQVFDIRKEKTWGQGGKADLITLSPKFGSGHVLVFSGPGGGKTAGIVIPTCLTYQHSLIVVDPELEILPATKAARVDMGRDVRAIRIGEGIDIIKFLSKITERRDQVYAHLAKIITEPSREQTSDVIDFFREEAQNIIAGLLNHYDSQGVKNPFYEVLKTISDEEESFKETVANIVSNADEGSLLKITLASYNKMDSRTFTSFQSTIKQSLKWAPYDALLNLVSSDPKDAVDPLAPNTDLYIQIKKADMDTYPGLVRLILGTIAYVIDDKPDGHERVMIIDEAYTVGRLKIFERIRDTARKKHLHLMLIFQTSGQLKTLYGDAGVRSWNDSMAARVYSTTEDPIDQEEISKMIGEYTADIEGKSKSSSSRGFVMSTPTSSSSNNTSLRNVRLMRPEQLRTLPNDGLIIFFRGFAPIVCGKAICFRRAEWEQYTPYKKE